MGTAPGARPRWTWTLRPVDQTCTATLVVASLLAIGVHVLGTRLTEFADPPESRSPSDAELEPFQLDVNSAPWPEWALLPGVGETLARRIVEYRDSVGGFQSVGELVRVRGIGPRTLERLRPHLTIEERRHLPSSSVPSSAPPWNSSSPARSPRPEINRRPSPP